MGIWDKLFGTKKGPGRGRVSADDDAEPSRADYTKAIRRDELARRAAPSDEWDAPPPARPTPPAERAEDRAPPPTPPPRRASAPPSYTPPSPPRAQAPEPLSDDDEPPPTEYAKVPRATTAKVAALLLGVEGPLEGHVIRIYQGENVLGREAEPDPKDSVTLLSISRKHAKLTADDGYFVLEPVQLKNATLVAGMPIDAHAVLQHGDRITLGTTKPCTFVLLAVPA